MSEKMTCPGCNSHTSSVLNAVSEGEPCPYCGLSAPAIFEVNALRKKREDDAIAERLAQTLMDVDRLRTENDELRRRLDAVRLAVEDVTSLRA